MNMQELAREYDNSVAKCTAEEVNTDLSNNTPINLIDVREDSEWISGHLPKAHHHALSRLTNSDVIGLPDDKSTPLTVYCGAGVRSIVASKILADHGYTNIRSMNGGITIWRVSNFPIVE